MDTLGNFLSLYGWELTLIAVLGIVLLGALKYLNVFSKLDKDKRKPVYMVISVGFSILASIIFLAVKSAFDMSYVVTLAGVIYALNQTFYSVYENTKLRELLSKIFNYIVENFGGNNEKN